ncbi:MAG TPA: hypothetical protein VKD91_00845 [Pyrinomonadaceae bacterium]|nr:hypothetical protein [Pyrinomonadaceae bacterium]
MKFMFLFVQLSEPNIETQQSLGAEWLASLVDGVVDSCAPFADDAKLVTKDAARDFIKGETHYGGYMIVNAESLAEAAEIARSSPHARLGGRITVRPVAGA